MKSHVPALIAMMLILQVSASAQAFRIDWHTETTVSQKCNLPATIDGDLVNLSSGELRFLFRYDISNLTPGHMGGFCFGTLCFYLFPGVDEPTERAEQVVQPGHTLDVHAILNGNNTPGTSSIWYRLYDSQDTTKMTEFTVTYNMTPLTSTVDASEFGISIGPNPTAEVVTISGSAVSTIKSINLYSSQGALVRTYGFAPSGAIQLNTTDLPSGSYHVIMNLSTGETLRSALSIVH